MNETVKKLVEESTDLVCTIDTMGEILWINNTSNEYLGVTPLKLKGRLYSELIHKKDLGKWENTLKKATSGENLNTCEIRLIHSNGENILLNCTLVWDATDKEYLCIGKSDSGSRSETNELLRSEDMYQILYDLSPIPKYVYDLETLRILDVNQAAIYHYGYSKEEFLNMKIQDLRIESDIPELMSAIEKYKTSTGILRFGAYKHRKKDGSIVQMDISGQKFSFGDQTRVMIVSNDVTLQQNELKQKKLLADIRQIFGKEKKLNNILENLLTYLVDVGEFQLGEIWLISRDHKLLSLTTTYPKSDFTSIFYEQSSEIKIFKKGIGLPGSVWNGLKTEIWDDLGKLKKFIRKKAAKEVGLHSAMGIPIVYNEELLGVLLLGSNKSGQHLNSLKGLFTDLETIIGAELKRKLLEEDYNQIFDTAPDIICMIDFESSFKRINPAGSKLLGYSEDELLNMPYSELVFPDDRVKFENQIKEYSQRNLASNFIHRVLTRSGEIVWLDWNLSNYTEEGVSYGVAKNITEENELQKLLDDVTNLAHIGGWEVDLISKRVYWSPMTKKLHEVDHDFEPDLESATNFYREDVRDTVTMYI